MVAGVEPSVLTPLQTGTRKTIVAGAVDGRVRAWGAFKSMIRQWSLLEPGDLCLFYTQGRTFTLCGRVSGRVESDVVAEAIWGRAPDDRTWSLMWFFDRLVPVNAPGVFVRDELGRANNAYFQNFAHVNPTAEEVLRSRYGSIEGFIEYIAETPPDLEGLVAATAGGDGVSRSTALDEAMAALDPPMFKKRVRDLTKSLPPKERTATRKILGRRYEVRAWLKKLYENKCQVCGFRFEKRGGGWYSEGAHLARVSLRLADLDVVQNMVILCADHHKMLDHGHMRIEWDLTDGKLMARRTENGDVPMANKHLGIGPDGFICTAVGAPS